jgi:hypothetical protein
MMAEKTFGAWLARFPINHGADHSIGPFVNDEAEFQLVTPYLSASSKNIPAYPLSLDGHFPLQRNGDFIDGTVMLKGKGRIK